MKTIAIFALTALGLSGCTLTNTLSERADTAQADMAYAAIVPVLMQLELPNGMTVPAAVAEPMAKCITENATVSELSSLAAASVTGATAETTYIVSNILNRASTTTCATNALSGGASA